jgi:hypothetical protein
MVVGTSTLLFHKNYIYVAEDGDEYSCYCSKTKLKKQEEYQRPQKCT